MRSRLAIGLLVTACYHGGGGPADDNAGSDGTAGTAGTAGSDADTTAGESGDVDPASLVPTPTRRLARFEVERTLAALFEPAAITAAEVALLALPNDRTGTVAFSTMTTGVTASHVDAYYRVADAIAAYVVADPTHRAALTSCLGDAAPDDACVRTFATDFGAKAWRRPLTTDEVDEIAAIVAAGAELDFDDGLANALVYLLIAPPFLYRLETGGDPFVDSDDTLVLTGHELAARLSYLAWGAPPDAELVAAAVDGSLDDDAVYQAQVERIFADPRASTHVQGFVEEWLDLDRLPAPQQSAEFLGGIAPDGLAEAIRAEALAFAADRVFADGAGYDALLTSTAARYDDAALGQLYGVAAGDDVDLPGRPGLLGRAGFLLGAGETTHPVKRGAKVMRKLLCLQIELPDPNDFPPNTIEPPPFDPDKTARERWTDQTSPAACAACHATINAPGFALEHYDALGRWRDDEPIVDPQTGEVVNTLPIDTQVEVQIDAPVAVDGVDGLAQAIATSTTGPRCLATQWLRFAAGRTESVDDLDAIDGLVAALAGDETPLLAMFRHLAAAPEFKLRKLDP